MNAVEQTRSQHRGNGMALVRAGIILQKGHHLFVPILLQVVGRLQRSQRILLPNMGVFFRDFAAAIVG